MFEQRNCNTKEGKQEGPGRDSTRSVTDRLALWGRKGNWLEDFLRNRYLRPYLAIIQISRDYTVYPLSPRGPRAAIELNHHDGLMLWDLPGRAGAWILHSRDPCSISNISTAALLHNLLGLIRAKVCSYQHGSAIAYVVVRWTQKMRGIFVRYRSGR